jgi:Tn3 transposase DDE domain
MKLIEIRTATKAVLFSTTIFLAGGIIGTFHHLYFTGASPAVIALGAVFIVGFHHPGHYADRLIKPIRKTFDALIVKEWPNIQRILASLAQRDVTQATVVRKLSSYARQNQAKKALWELDNIRRTIYILDFINDSSLRQGVQKALNRGEAYPRMRRAISYVNSGKFHGTVRRCYPMNLFAIALLRVGDCSEDRGEDHSRPVNPRQGLMKTDGTPGFRSGNFGGTDCKVGGCEIHSCSG